MGPEKRFENKIKLWLTTHGCYHVKFFANRMTKSGVPDILACVNGYFVGIEVKAQNGKPEDLQFHNLRWIRQSGGFAWIVYPSGWEELKKILEGLLEDKFNKLDEREVLK